MQVGQLSVGALKVLVTGATGNVGREVVAALVARGVGVRATGKGGSFAPSVERVSLDFTDAETFEPAVHGCNAVFLLRPPAVAKVKTTLNPFIDTARALGAGHIVFLSVAGAGTNKLVPHHAVEQHLLASGAPYTLLRPGFFAQNLGDAYRRDIVEDQRLYVPAGQGRVAFVDARDLAEVAALALSDPKTHAGQAYTLTGGEAVDFSEAASWLSETLRRPIRYVPAAVLGYMHHLHRRGLPAKQVLVQTILHTGLRFGQAATVDPTLQQLLGRAPRTLREYVRDHAALWAKA